MVRTHPACVAIDFETSAYRGPCACAIGMARIEDMRVTDEFYSLIRPPSSRVYFTHVHGLTWQVLADAPSFPQLWPDISAFIGNASYLVAHNAPFDRKVLESCCDAFGLGMPEQPFLCTLKGSRKADLSIPSRSLSSVCAYFGIELEHHHAGSDARACGIILTRLLKMGFAVSDLLLSK